jgi:DNA-binding transcriptional MerR regulator
MASILDQSPEVIAKVLKATGMTIEEVKALLAQVEASDDPSRPQALEGADPTQEKKFTMPIGAIFPDE